MSVHQFVRLPVNNSVSAASLSSYDIGIAFTANVYMNSIVIVLTMRNIVIFLLAILQLFLGR